MSAERYPRALVNYAKELYLETYINDKNQKKKRYTWKQIKELVDKKFKTDIHIQSLKYYASKENWNLEMEAIISNYTGIAKKGKEEDLSPEKYSIEMKKEVEEDVDKVLELFSKAKKQAVLNQIRVSNRMNEAMKTISEDSKYFARYCEVASKVNKTLMEMLDMIDIRKSSTEKPIIIINEVNIDNN